MRKLKLESLQQRLVLAGDIAGVFGESASLVEDINPTPRQGVFQSSARVVSAVELDGRLVYAALDGGGDVEIWSTNGNSNIQQSEIDANLFSPDLACCQLTRVGDQLYLQIDRVDPTFEPDEQSFVQGISELWRTDGQPGGTDLLAELGFFDDFQRGSAQVIDDQGEPLVAWTESFLSEQWTQFSKLDSADHLAPAGRLFALSNYRPVSYLTPFAGDWYFIGGSSDLSPTYGLWKTDSESNTIQLVRSFQGDEISGGGPSELTVHQGAIYFAANGGQGMEIWKSDGTPTGTAQVVDLRAGASGSEPTALTPTVDGLLFEANDGRGTQVWITDGTATGTRSIPSNDPRSSFSDFWVETPGLRQADAQLLDIRTARLANLPFRSTVVQHDDLYFFHERDNQGTFGLWVTDGTDDRTQLVMRDATTANVVGNFNGEAVLAKEDQLLTLNATSFALSRLAEIEIATSDSDPLQLVSTDDGAVFLNQHDSVLRNATHSGETVSLWESDFSFESINSFGNEFEEDSQVLLERAFENLFVALNAEGIFVRNLETNTVQQLVQFEGDPARQELIGATHVLHEYYLFRYVAPPSESARIETWKSDGTPEGTELISSATTTPSFALTIPTAPRAVDDNVYFTHQNALRVLRPDGSNELLRTGVTGTTIFGDDLYYIRQSGFSAPFEIWKYDGTNQTKIFSESIPQTQGIPTGIETVGAKLYFGDGSGGLWVSDGTAGDATLIRQFDSLAADFAAGSERLFFVAGETATGSEVWVTDGTRAGTELAADIRPGRNSSVPQDLTMSGDTLFLSANDGQHGRELWRINVAQSSPADLDGDGAVNFSDFLIFFDQFGSSSDQRTGVGDLNFDGEVDFADFLIISASFGKPI